MTDRIADFWATLGRLTFQETTIVAETMRDAHNCTIDFEPADVADWSFLLNTAREIAEDRSVDAALNQ